MARSVFTSFHYQRDIFRVNVVRNQYLCKGGYNAAGYWDHSLWEETKQKGDAAVRTLINSGLTGSTVTVVLIGAQTANRKWVNYELEESHRRVMGIFGIYIHGISDPKSGTDYQGQNPLSSVTGISPKGSTVVLSSLYPVYDWNIHDGYKNYGAWVEAAARAAGR